MGTQGVPLDKKQIIQALEEKKGVIEHAAKHVPCTPRAIYSWMERDPDIANAVIQSRANADKERKDKNEVLKEKAYTSVEKLLENGDLTATIFTLKTLCGWKEQTQDHQIVINRIEKPYRETKTKKEADESTPFSSRCC